MSGGVIRDPECLVSGYCLAVDADSVRSVRRQSERSGRATDGMVFGRREPTSKNGPQPRVQLSLGESRACARRGFRAPASSMRVVSRRQRLQRAGSARLLT